MPCLLRPTSLILGLAVFLVVMLVCPLHGPTPSIVSRSGYGYQLTTIHYSDLLGTTLLVDGNGRLLSVESRLLGISWAEITDELIDPSDPVTPE